MASMATRMVDRYWFDAQTIWLSPTEALSRKRSRMAVSEKSRPNRGDPSLLNAEVKDRRRHGRDDLDLPHSQNVCGPAHEDHHTQAEGRRPDNLADRDPVHHLEALEQPALEPGYGEQPDAEEPDEVDGLLLAGR